MSPSLYKYAQSVSQISSKIDHLVKDITMSSINLDESTGSPRHLSPESSLNKDDWNKVHDLLYQCALKLTIIWSQVSVTPLNSEHLYLTRHTLGMLYPPVATNTPRPTGLGSSRRRDNDGGRVASRTNSEPQILAPSVANSSSSPITTKPPGMQTDSPQNAGVLHSVGSSHPLASTLPILSLVSTIQSNVRNLFSLAIQRKLPLLYTHYWYR